MRVVEATQDLLDRIDLQDSVIEAQQEEIDCTGE
jgi:hypothetical protein